MKRLYILSLLVILLWSPASTSFAEPGVPILLYHRFGPVVADSMTITTPVFESHLKHLSENGYKIIPLRELMDMYFGKGIPPDQLARLFHKFQQLDSSDARRVPGTGLGLAITKALVEQHGGRVGVSSTPGAGTTFYFTLPCAAAGAVVPAGEAVIDAA